MPDDKKTIILRPATLEDARLLLMWRNDPLTRQNSIQSKPITWKKHLQWLKDATNSESIEIYIAERCGIPVGTIRFEQQQNSVELSWTVSPEHRGKGIGKHMVSLSIQQISKPITAKIKPTNLASIAIARHIGMKQISSSDGMLYFILSPATPPCRDNHGQTKS